MKLVKEFLKRRKAKKLAAPAVPDDRNFACHYGALTKNLERSGREERLSGFYDVVERYMSGERIADDELAKINLKAVTMKDALRPSLTADVTRLGPNDTLYCGADAACGLFQEIRLRQNSPTPFTPAIRKGILGKLGKDHLRSVSVKTP